MTSHNARHHGAPSRWAMLAAAPFIAPALGASLDANSSVGVSAGYYSNPLLLHSGSTSAESLAALLNLPLTYTARTSTLTLDSRLRFTATRGRVAPLSDYRYFDFGWNRVGKRNRLDTSLTWHSDSTFYDPFENGALAGTSVRKIDSSASFGWTHQLSGRNELHLQTSAERVNYEKNVAQNLVDYDYGQLSAQYAHTISPRTRVYAVSGIARFQFQDHSYCSDNRYVQLGFDRDLAKRWSLSARAGLSGLRIRLTTLNYFVDRLPDGTYVLVKRPVDHYSTARTGNYSASLQYRYARYKLDFEASRALQPSGLGALVTQEDLGVRLSGAWSELLNVGLSLGVKRQVDSQQRLVSGDRRYGTVGVNADWRLSAFWTLGLQATYERERIELQQSFDNTSVFLTISRQLARHRLN